MIRKLLLMMMLGVAVFVFSGCNTVSGFGRDVQKAGEGLQRASQPDK